MERRNLALLCAGVLCFWLFALAVGTARGAGLRVAIGGTGPAVQADAPAVLAAAPANSGLQLECRAAILMEPETGCVLYEKAPDERMPIASITKVMTLLLTFEAVHAGRLTMDTAVPVSEHAYHMGGSQIWLEPGEQFTLDEMLRAICAIANGGNLVRPYVVKKVTGPDGKVIKENKTQVDRQVITPEVASQMRAMMEKVVSEGGGKSAQIKGYKIAGKTGTAEKLSPKGGYIPGVYIASFVGFVPSDNPRYAMIIMIDSPKGAYYGAQVSAPIFRDTLQQILVAQGVQPSNKADLKTMDSLAEKDGGKEGTLPSLAPSGEKTVRLPNLAGWSLRETMEILQKGGLQLLPIGSGISFKQSPPPGTTLNEGDAVTVWFR